MHRLQWADKVLGYAACCLLQPLSWARRLRRRHRRPLEGGPERVLLIKFWGIGSLQLLTPAVTRLRREYPGARLTLLTLRQNGSGARAFGVFDEVLTLEVADAGWLVVFGRIVRLVLGLRRRRFDVVFDFEFFTRFSAIVSVLTGARATHGFESPSVWRGRFHTRSVPFNRYWHVARNFRVLAGDRGAEPVEAEDLEPVRCDETDRARVRERLVEAGLASRDGTEPGDYVVLNPNAGQLSLERRWPRAQFAELAERLWREHGVGIVLIGGAGERSWTAGLAELARMRAPGIPLLDLAGSLSITELAALLLSARACVSNDSGPMHLAAALGTPTVGLFGPETPVMYEPLGATVRSLYDPPACSPCINVHDNKVATCIHGRPECLVNLTPARVHESCRELLEGAAATLRPVPRSTPAPRADSTRATPGTPPGSPGDGDAARASGGS